jgi:ADP-heptose:LPS heptosyltransferase
LTTARRILFVDLWRLGDAVAATAGLRALRIACPDAEIGVVAHSVSGDPLFRSTAADHRIRFDAFWTRGKTARDKYVPWTIDYGALYRCAKMVRAFRPDACLLFRGDPREQAFFMSIGVPALSDVRRYRIIVPGVRYASPLTGVPRYREYLHQVAQWSGRPADAMPGIDGVTVPTEREGVLIHPGASWRYKQWSAQHVAALASAVIDRGVAVTLVGSEEDRPFIESVQQACGAGTVAAVFPTLEELYRRIAAATAIVCNNSGALHIAEALGTPCVAITGSSDPVRWGTYRAHSRTLCKSVGLACHPCAERRCVRPQHPCVDDVSVVDVVEALGAIGCFADAPLVPATRQVKS